MKCQLSPQSVAALLRQRPSYAHKGIMGHALLVAGRADVAGCAMLSAEACLRAGCGKLTVHTAEQNRTALHVAVPEAILYTHEDSMPDGLEAYQSIGIGPGIGLDSIQKLTAYLRETSLPIVIDADAIRLLALNPAIADCLSNRAILTPHAGEAKALAEGFMLDEALPLEEQMQTFAQRYGVVVVLKPSAICMPDGRVVHCPRGNAGMATAGSGDVLTGLLTGLLAQGYPIDEAAMLGVWLHASAGDFAAAELGEECLLARDIIRHLPEAYREIRN